AEEVGRADMACDGIAVAGGAHVLEAGEQQCGSDALISGGFDDADRPDEATSVGVVAGEAEDVGVALGDEEGDGTVGKGRAGFAEPDGSEAVFDPSFEDGVFGASRLANHYLGAGTIVSHRLIARKFVKLDQ